MILWAYGVEPKMQERELKWKELAGDWPVSHQVGGWEKEKGKGW